MTPSSDTSNGPVSVAAAIAININENSGSRAVLGGESGALITVNAQGGVTVRSSANHDAASTADYAPAPLREQMAASDYLLQATLYQVALHRYLQWRLPSYDPGTHLGGAMYLFLRGMIGGDTPVYDGNRAGVFRWSPPSEFIVALSERFDREAP